MTIESISKNAQTHQMAVQTIAQSVTDDLAITGNTQSKVTIVNEEDLPMLFERLYRLESSRNRETGGAGLGLSICRNIVEAHEGTISARRSPIGGLWIKIEFPCEA